MNIGLLILVVLFVAALTAVLRRGRADTLEAAERGLEQFAFVIPQLGVALMSAGFLAKLIPSAFVGALMGPEAGLTGILVGAVAGPIIPAGPVLAFAIAAVFERAGATQEALVAFVTSWSLFTIHRVITYELPLLGFSFLKLRLLSVGLMPVAAGLIAAGILRAINAMP